MGRVAFTRRELLISGSAFSASFLVQPQALADDAPLLGLKLPKEVFDIIPRKSMNILRIADSVINLEREADDKGLPQSPLALGKGQSFTDITNSLYQFAMPRLVALIDRSEARDTSFADKAGEVLAQLHRNQYELPDALRLLSTAFAVPSRREKGVRYFVQEQDQPQIAPTTIIFEPGTPPPDSPATAPDLPTEPKSDTPPQLPQSQLPEPADIPINKARDFVSLKAEYARLFRTIEIRPQYAEKANWHLEMMRRSRPRYQSVAEVTGVPWYFIAAIHALEASFNFRAHLHNGDFPLSSRTRQVPAGRPLKWLPPSDWESSAKDALRLLGFTGQSDWSLERTLYRLEVYNGLGYRSLGFPTPYLWSFSNHYDRGKFVADGKFSGSARSQQCGTAIMVKLLADAGDIQIV
jgi:lysozyme family protein